MLADADAVMLLLPQSWKWHQPVCLSARQSSKVPRFQGCYCMWWYSQKVGKCVVRMFIDGAQVVHSRLRLTTRQPRLDTSTLDTH